MKSRENEKSLVHVGKLFKKSVPTPLQSRLMDARDSAPATIEDASFLHSVLCQVGMPRKKTESLTFERRSGNTSLRLTAGSTYRGVKWTQQPLPYGPKPRLILINLTSYAVKNKTPVVNVGRSTHEFMKRLGFDRQGSEYRSLRQQFLALSVCRMQLGHRSGCTVDAQPIRGLDECFDAWITPKANQQTLWPGTIELTKEYFESLQEEAAVPLDERALVALRGSALALDVYTWLAHRLCRVRRSSGDMVSWQNLKEQFGHEYNRLDHFREEFRKALLESHQVYRDARIMESPEGLCLLPSRPPIPKINILVPHKIVEI